MAHRSNSTDYDIFIANMQYVNVTDDSIELLYNECDNCSKCPFNLTTSSCEFSIVSHEEDYYKLLHYISTHHPEKFI